MNQFSRIVCLLVGLSETNLGVGAGLEFHVSPNGNDGPAGTLAEPLRTLSKARDAIRRAKSSGNDLADSVTVIAHEGTYWLPEPFELGAEDGGTATAPIVYRAEDGGTVRFNGGIPLRPGDFRPVTDQEILDRLPQERTGRLVAYRFTAEQHLRFAPPWPDTWWTEPGLDACNELFADGRRLPLARWPNDDYTAFGEIVEPASEAGKTPEFKYTDQRPERWNVDDGVWLYGYWRRGFRAEFVRVKAVNTDAKTIQLAARNSLGELDDEGAHRYFAVNQLEELDAAGEWYLDRDGGTLYLILPKDLQDDHVTFSINPEALIRCAGTQHVEFRGLGIECSARDRIRIEGGPTAASWAARFAMWPSPALRCPATVTRSWVVISMTQGTSASRSPPATASV